MPTEVKDIDVLRLYIHGVMGRADHHADAVSEVALTLAGAIVWSKDPGKAIEVRGRDGDFKNVLWVAIRGTRYAFSYNHNAKKIEMRRDSLQGPVVAAFDNATSAAGVRASFEAL